MIIQLDPQAAGREKRYLLEKQGDALIINGEVFDFSSLPEGARLDAEHIGSDVFSRPVTRRNGEIVVSLLLPHSGNAPKETMFPSPIHQVEDGEVELPIYEVELPPLEGDDIDEPENEEGDVK